MRISDWSSDVCSSDLARTPTSSDRTPGPERLRQRAFIEVIEFAAHGQPMRQLGDAHRKPLDPLGDIMRGGLALERGVHRQHDRSEERRVGKSVSVRVDLGGRRIIKKKKILNTKDRKLT